MADLELHFPLHIAEEYIDTSGNIFDSPPVFGVDVFTYPVTTVSFTELYYYIRRKLAGKFISKDIIVYHYDTIDGPETKTKEKKVYEVSCKLSKGYQIDRLITVHAMLTYRHPIAEYIRGLSKSINEFKSLYTIDKFYNSLFCLSIPFAFVSAGNERNPKRLKILTHHSIRALATFSNYFSPLSFSSQIIYALARFIADNALVNEYICAELNAECEEYIKKCCEALEKARVELDRYLYEDKIIAAVDYVLQYSVDSERLTLPIAIDEIIRDFNRIHDCDIHPQAVSSKIYELYKMGRIAYEGGRWKVRV